MRNHDELTLDKLSDDERQEVFAAFGPDEDMQVYGRGLRRRLPPMLDGDPRRIRMVYSLLFSLPGTPVLFYGEEIGMGENLDVAGPDGRAHADAVDRRPRTAASPPRRPTSCPAPVVEGGYAPEHVNVEAQRRDPDSLLSFISLLVRRYRECPELGWGEFAVLEQPHAPGARPHRHLGRRLPRRRAQPRRHRRHRAAARCPTCPRARGWPTCSSTAATRVDEDGSFEVPLEAYGFRWLRVVRPGDRRLV